MVAAAATHANGRTVTEDVVREVAAEVDEPVKVELDSERRTGFRRTGFSRMQLDWKPDDAIMMKRIHQAVDRKIEEYFDDLLALWYDILARVRVQEESPGPDGLPVWERTITGAYVENWERLGSRERERYIYQITTSIMDWEKRASQAWAEAMFAKAQWEEAFATGFQSVKDGKATVDARTAEGKVYSADERYFAIYLSYYSRVAEGHVRGMRDLAQRIKDVHVAASGR